MPPQISEHDILTTYLLPPSSLQTVLPYTAFLQHIVPPSLRKNPDLAPALRSVYRDFVFQRTATLDRVREAIEREAGVGSAGLRARLVRRIAFDEGREERRKRRQRRRPASTDREEVVMDTATESSASDLESGSESDSDKEYARQKRSERILLATERAMADDPSSVHPAAHVLPRPSSERQGLEQQLQQKYKRRFHTKTSLLEAMRRAEKELEKENGELEAEVQRVLGDIKEIVGGLSDLRYGRLNDGVEERALEALKMLQ